MEDELTWAIKTMEFEFGERIQTVERVFFFKKAKEMRVASFSFMKDV